MTILNVRREVVLLAPREEKELPRTIRGPKTLLTMSASASLSLVSAVLPERLGTGHECRLMGS